MVHVGLSSLTISLCHGAEKLHACIGLFLLPLLGMVWEAEGTKGEGNEGHNERRLKCLQSPWDAMHCLHPPHLRDHGNREKGSSERDFLTFYPAFEPSFFFFFFPLFPSRSLPGNAIFLKSRLGEGRGWTLLHVEMFILCLHVWSCLCEGAAIWAACTEDPMGSKHKIPSVPNSVDSIISCQTWHFH